MSGYYDDNDDDTRRRRSHRKSRPIYEEEIIERRTTKQPRDAGQMQLVRRKDSDESVEEIRRDFIPGDGTYIQRRTTTRDRYANRRKSADYDYDEEDYYESRRGAPRRSQRNEGRRYEADSESDSSPPPPRRRKSISEQALAAIGLGGGAAAAASSRKNRDREKDRGSDYDDRRDRRDRPRRDSDEMRASQRSKSVDSRGGGGLDNKQKVMQAAKAAVTAAAIEAFRSRKEPGGFANQGKRILTAAIGAAGIDGVLDRGEEHKTRHTIEAALGGLAGNRLINGAREGSRSRSRAREGKSDIGGIASAAGLAALAGQAFNNYRSKSRGRQEDQGSRSGSPDGRPRSRSVSDYLRGGVDDVMAKLGLTAPKDENRGREGRDEGRRDGRSRGGYDSEDDNYRARPRGGGAEEPERPQKRDNSGSSSSSSSSDTDSYDSEKEIKKQKKLKRRTLITAGLASVATIHAVANVHGSMEKAKVRHKELASGKITQEQAKKKKTKALLQDAVAVGIAGIGIQSAFHELKELKEGRSEYVHACKRFEEKRQHRRLKQVGDKSGHGSNNEDNDRDDQRHNSDHGVYYYDDNPYGARDYPPPPMTSVPYRDSRDSYYR